MGVICHFNNTTKGEKKRCTVYFLNETKCVFIFHEGHWRECHTNIRVLLLIRNLSTPELLKQVCRPVLCVSSCRMKMQPHACYLIPCDPIFLFICLLLFSFDAIFICHTFQFQHLSEGQCLFFLLLLLFLGKKKRSVLKFLNVWNGAEGVSKSIRRVFSNRFGTVSF